MATRSIYLEGTMFSPLVSTQIAVFDSELKSCEALMTMGYTASHGQSLWARAKFLNEQIDALEVMQRRGIIFI